MRVLLVGSGGREAALGWALSKSAAVTELVAAPGNPGLARLAETIALDPSNPDEVVGAARRSDADLVVIGPEAPLVAGAADRLRDDGRLVFGPDAAAARIEGSKAYAKSLMAAAGIPTGRSAVVRSLDEGAAALDLLGPPYVVKADGLAAGKGVVVTEERAEAQAALGERLSGAFGDAGRTVVIEEFLEGPELSLIAFADGQTAVACAPARDYKRLRDGDEGPNTGGMGSYSPVPGCDDDLVERILGEIMEPLLKETAARGAPFVGALYAGLALTPAGPRVIEFNARFGDPETQALIPRLESDLGAVCLACARGELSGVRLRWSPQACVSVVLAAPGYPASPGTGAVISGVEQACCLRDVQVFQAGTAERDGALVTAGGRVLVVSARGHGLEAARARAYEAAGLISFEGVQRRNDIAVAGRDGVAVSETRGE